MIEWDESYSVQVRVIDEQHKKLFDAVNDFERAVSAGEGREAFTKLLKFLVDYSRFHFETEEKYFEKYEFELSEAHIEQHQAFIRIVETYMQRFEADDLLVPAEVQDFLNRWVTEHVLRSDQRYIECFRAHGLS